MKQTTLTPRDLAALKTRNRKLRHRPLAERAAFLRDFLKLRISESELVELLAAMDAEEAAGVPEFPEDVAPPAGRTPGPWEWNADQLAICEATNARRILAVMSIDQVETPPKERDANARLIAASPTLLTALQAVVAFYPTDRRGTSVDEDKLLQRVDAAIAKATNPGA